MHRVQLHYTLSRDAGNALIRNPLPEMLQAVAEQGSISGAARALGLSYRHVWGALKRWEDQLGGELIIWGKGQSAQLSEFGTKLLWAERQAQARLAPQIAALHADLERAFAVAFDDSTHVLTMYASHDDALGALRAHAATPGDGGAVHLDIRFTAAWTPFAHSTKDGARWRAFTRSKNPQQTLWPRAPTAPCCNRVATRSSGLRGAPRVSSLHVAIR